MDFRYGAAFAVPPPEAYERLLLDVMLGDPTLFTRTDEVESAWRFITTILQAWDRPNAVPPVPYVAGTWGPPEADATTCLRLIADAAQRDMDESATERTGDRRCQRCLADARRPDEAENRSCLRLSELMDGQIIQDAFLDFLQAVMIAFQNLRGIFYIEIIR